MVYMFLADGFEEIEALCPLDVMRRAGIDVTTVGVNRKNVLGAHGIEVVADITVNEFDAAYLDMIILPGGMPGTVNLEHSAVCISAIRTAALKGRYVAAICAAPSILGKLGLLEGKEAVCYPGFEDELKGARVLDCGVCVDGNVITAAGMGVALEFGLTLVELLKGKETAAKIFTAVQAHKR